MMYVRPFLAFRAFVENTGIMPQHAPYQCWTSAYSAVWWLSTASLYFLLESNSLAKGEDWKKKLKERVTDHYALFESVELRDIHCLSRGSASWDITQTHTFKQEVTHNIYIHIHQGAT